MTRAYFVGWLVAVTQLRVEGKSVDGGFMLAGLEPKGPPGSRCTLLQRPLELFSVLNCPSEYTQLLTKGTSAFTKPKN